MRTKMEQDIRRKLSDHEVPAPELSWDAVDAELDRRRAAARKHRPVVMWRRVTVAASLAVAIGAAWWWYAPTADDAVQMAEAGGGTEEPAASRTLYNNIKERAAVAWSKATGGRVPSTGRRVSVADDAATGAEGVMLAAVGIGEGQENVLAQGSSEEPQQGVAATSQQQKTADNQQSSADNNQQTAAANKQETTRYTPHYAHLSGTDSGRAARSSSHRGAGSGLTAQVWMGGGAASASSNGFYPTVAGAMQSPTVDYPGNMMNENTQPELAETSSEPDHVKHRLPVSVGLGVGYQLTDRWRVTAGVTYSKLHSCLEFDRYASLGKSGRQDLHYVGVPVAASYTVWNSRHLNVYLTAGGAAAKLVKGKRSVTTPLGDGVDDVVTADVKESRPQFSANAAAGVEYSFVPAVSLYLEPGAAYYFDNGSQVDNIYKDKPLNFSLNLGLRINIK